jgi:hypothetical protein
VLGDRFLAEQRDVRRRPAERHGAELQHHGSDLTAG